MYARCMQADKEHRELGDRPSPDHWYIHITLNGSALLSGYQFTVELIVHVAKFFYEKQIVTQFITRYLQRFNK